MATTNLALRLLVLLIAVCCIRPVLAEQLTLAVASNFNLAMQPLVAEYEKNHNIELHVAFASSGKLYAQIVNGAPYDLFFSADQTKSQALIDLGLADVSSRFTYAYGRLALWSAKPNWVDSQGEVLQSSGFNKLALANPKLAPYGAAAIEVLTKLELITATQARWVQGENISQTYQFVATQNADLGFVAASQIIYQGSLKSGSAWLVPDNHYQPIKQDAVIINSTKNIKAAKDFMGFMQSPKARAIMQDFGYHHGQTL